MTSNSLVIVSGAANSRGVAWCVHGAKSEQTAMRAQAIEEKSSSAGEIATSPRFVQRGANEA
jgi:hypothetical protein